MLGFAIGSTLVPGKSQAYSLTNAVYYGLIISSTTTTTGAIIGGIVLTAQTVDPAPDGVVQPGDTTRRLLDAAMLVTCSELSMHLDLLHNSPSAYAQLSQELLAGEGPAVDAMVRATRLPVSMLQADWQAAREAEGVAGSAEEAHQVITAFIKQISPKLSVPTDIAAEVSWKLIREHAAAAEGDALQTTHQWMAEWLGVSTASVARANERALQQLGGAGDEALRAQLYADPEPFLRALSVNLELTDKASIEGRVDALLAQHTAPGALSGKAL